MCCFMPCHSCLITFLEIVNVPRRRPVLYVTQLGIFYCLISVTLFMLASDVVIHPIQHYITASATVYGSWVYIIPS